MQLLLTASLAQRRAASQADEPPTWPEDGRIPPEHRDRLVFLTRDEHTIVVLVPQAGGSKKIVRVALKNDLVPSMPVAIQRLPESSLEYAYTLENGQGATDAIGACSLIVAAEDPTLKVIPPIENSRRLWSGSAARHSIAKETMFPQTRPGEYVLWFHQDDNFIRPGTKIRRLPPRIRLSTGIDHGLVLLR